MKNVLRINDRDATAHVRAPVHKPPRIGSTIQTPQGPAEVIAYDGTTDVATESGGWETAHAVGVKLKVKK